ncbi:MAG: hypothetical protein ABJB49_10850 [Nitrospirota bacterium]
MKTLKMKKLVSSVALVTAIFLITTHGVVAQEIRIGGMTISIPKRAKTPPKTPMPESPAPKVETGEQSSAGGEEARTDSPPTSHASTTQSDAWLEIILEEINKRKKEVESYEPGEGRQIVTRSTPELFFPAISLRARERYFKSVQMNETRRSALNTALDSLAATAAKKLPLYKPDATIFAFRSPPSQQMMLSSLMNAATLKVHKTGIKEATWLIEKNELGIPVDRYKHGYIWVRDSNDDHPYCHLYTLHITQTYAGGGTYGQTFVKLSDDELVGCP